MRPRINPIEAQFLYEVLTKELTYYTILEQQLTEKMKPLKLPVAKACSLVNHYFLSTAKRDFNYPVPVQELCKLEAQDVYVLKKLTIYKELLCKYKQIANGTKSRGRYREDCTRLDEHLRGLNDKIFLGYKDSNTALQVEAPRI
jgi:hypothetical protein